jgi:hypothetical protein
MGEKINKGGRKSATWQAITKSPGAQNRGSDVQQPVCMFKRFSVE